MSNPQVWAFLLGLTFLRLVVAASLPLTPDEAYYWVWSQHLQAGYPDHPPLVALFIRAGVALCGPTALGVRFWGPWSVLLGSGLIWAACRDACFAMGCDAKRAWRAPIVLNATLMIGLGGILMTPDTPLMLAVALVLRGLAGMQRDGRGFWWLVVGAGLGCGFDGKYTAALLAAAIIGWLILQRAGRAELWRAAPWAGAVLAALLTLPVLQWNAHHGWVSLLKQGGRSADWEPARAGQFLGELVGGQIGLATPLIAFLFALAVWRAVRSGSAGIWLWSVILPFGVFLEHALGARVQANWPVVVYPGLAVLVGCFVRKVIWASALGYAMTACALAQALWGVVPLSAHHDPMARELAGWPEFAQNVRSAVGSRALGVADYGLASELAFQGGASIIGLDSRWGYIAGAKPASAPEMVLLRTDERPGHEVGEAEPLAPICRLLHGSAVRCYRLYHAGPDVLSAGAMTLSAR